MANDLYKQPTPNAAPANNGKAQREASKRAGDQARAKKTPKSQKVSAALVR